MKQVLGQQIDISSESKPVIAGTSVSVEEVLAHLATGMEANEVMKACQLKDDRLMDVAVEYAETLPPNSHLAQLLKQYRQQQKQKVDRILLQFKHHCLEQYKQRLVRLILFGSYVRGEFKPSSDIDVLVVLKPPLNWQVDSEQTTEFTSDISIETGELLSSVFMDEDEFQQSPSLLLVNVRREGIVL